MAYSDFKTIGQVLRDYPLELRTARYLPDVRLDLPEWFLGNLSFLLDRQAVEESEAYLSESFIFPFLQLAWQRHGRLKLWSHRALDYDDKLNGEPDYFVSAWAEGVVDKLVTRPFMAVVEAKREKFDMGWAQCLVELLACQKLNGQADTAVHGIVSTGQIWQFGKLEGQVFTRHPIAYSIADPERIFGLLDFVFTECERALSSADSMDG
jgi:hypothetical protein